MFEWLLMNINVSVLFCSLADRMSVLLNLLNTLCGNRHDRSQHLLAFDFSWLLASYHYCKSLPRWVSGLTHWFTSVYWVAVHVCWLPYLQVALLMLLHNLMKRVSAETDTSFLLADLHPPASNARFVEPLRLLWPNVWAPVTLYVVRVKICITTSLLEQVIYVLAD